jgi:hypothetical protein
MILKKMAFWGCIALAIALSGCACSPEVDVSLMTGDPCAIPCWHNITPGVSDEDTVRDQLENSPFVRKGTLRHDPIEKEGAPLTMFAWRDQEGDFNRIYFRDGKVLRIEIGLDYDLTLGQVVDKYGPPEYVYTYARGSFEYFVFFSYPTQGLEVQSYLSAPDASNYIVSRDTGIVSNFSFR